MRETGTALHLMSDSQVRSRLFEQVFVRAVAVPALFD